MGKTDRDDGIGKEDRDDGLGKRDRDNVWLKEIETMYL